MKIKLTYTLLCSIILLACNNSSIEVKNGLPAIIFKVDEGLFKTDSSGYEGLSIKFYDNGTYSHFGYNFYAYGKWLWNERTRIATLNPSLSKDSNFVQHYKIEKTEEGNYTIKKIVMLDSGRYAQHYPYETIAINKRVTIDPFTEAMNTWRIKPTQSESKAVIKERTVKYLKFLLCYYEFIQESELKTYSKIWYATPIQMHYVNGARMSYSNELTDWYACFYSTDEGNEAYKLIATAMRKSKIDYTLSISKRNIDYLKQLIKAIEERIA